MDKLAFREIQKKLKLTNEGVSEAMDVELFAVQQWAAGTWPVPKAMAKFLRTLLSAKRDMADAHMSGYHQGRNNGYKESRPGTIENYTAGYDEGYREGLEVGQRRGEIKGQDEGYSRGYGHGSMNNM